MRAPTVGALRSGSSGIAQAGTPVCSRQPCGDRVELVGVGAVRDDGEQARVGHHQLGQASSVICASSSAVRALDSSMLRPVSTRMTGAPRFAATLRVETELGRAADVGEVGADDDHGVALALDLLEAVDDGRERGIRVLMHVLVGHADALVVVEGDAVVGEQQLEHLVALGRRPGDRPEHADAPHPAQERVEHPERDRGLARMPLRRADVDAPGHTLSLRKCPFRTNVPVPPGALVRKGHFGSALGGAVRLLQAPRVAPSRPTPPGRRRSKGNRALTGARGVLKEDSPSGLWRTLGKRVGCKPSGVRIPHPPLKSL